MKIEILCRDGSPLGVTTKSIWGDRWRVGVGGAELALLTMCEEWHNSGYEVILYNNPNEVVSPFEQRHVNTFDPMGQRDVLIVFRSPNPKAVAADGFKVWWSTDQYTTGDYQKFAPTVDKIVCISPFHADYFRETYDIGNTTIIDLPVRTQDYKAELDKVPYRMIFTSIPDRGLDNLWNMWNAIKGRVPEASLVITSDYRLWGSTALNEKHRVRWMAHQDIKFLGAIPRKELVEEELKAELFPYPCTYEELFCISCAEAQYAGAYPVTSNTGALATTNMGTIIPVPQPRPQDMRTFIQAFVDALKDRDTLYRKQIMVHEKAKERFAPEVIKKKWDEEIFK